MLDLQGGCRKPVPRLGYPRSVEYHVQEQTDLGVVRSDAHHIFIFDTAKLWNRTSLEGGFTQ